MTTPSHSCTSRRAPEGPLLSARTTPGGWAPQPCVSYHLKKITYLDTLDHFRSSISSWLPLFLQVSSFSSCSFASTMFSQMIFTQRRATSKSLGPAIAYAQLEAQGEGQKLAASWEGKGRRCGERAVCEELRSFHYTGHLVGIPSSWILIIPYQLG